MKIGRFFGAAIGVWIIRVAMNATFFGMVVGPRMNSLVQSHPALFRTVIPAYVIADLITAVVFVLLLAKVSAALGGGIKAGVKLGVFVAILAPILGSVYEYYSVTYMAAGLTVGVGVYQLCAHIIQGVVAGLIYKD